jgi:hypothetical protein
MAAAGSGRVVSWPSAKRPALDFAAMTGQRNALASAGAGGRRAPDFFIVGHPKSGTSALYEMLSSYPQIHMPRKEPGFFVPELRWARSTRFAGGLEDYLALFDGAAPEQRIGEATTSYLFSKQAARRIAEVQPSARIVAILREPASFLRSLHLQFLRSHVETERDLRRALALEQPRREGKQLPTNSTRPQALIYSEHVRYVEQLKRYHAVFPPDQVLVLIYEDFRADNVATVQQVLGFLGIEGAPPVQPVEVNRAAGLRSTRLQQTVRSLYLGRAPGARVAKSTVKALTPRSARRRALAIVDNAQRSDPPPLDPALARELQDRFKHEVQSVSEYLGRDLVSFWGYDRIA